MQSTASGAGVCDDSSESVGPENFQVIKDFVNTLIDRVSVSPEGHTSRRGSLQPH